jgi:hypothetical protein
LKQFGEFRIWIDDFENKDIVESERKVLNALRNLNYIANEVRDIISHNKHVDFRNFLNRLLLGVIDYEDRYNDCLKKISEAKEWAERKRREAKERAERRKKQMGYALWATAALGTLWFITAIPDWPTDDPPRPPPEVIQAPSRSAVAEPISPADHVTEPAASKPVSVYNSFLVSYLSSPEMENYRLGNSIYDINKAGSGFVADNGIVRFGYLGDFDGDAIVRPSIALEVEGRSGILQPTHCHYDHSPASPAAGQRVRSRTICGFELAANPGTYEVSILFDSVKISGDRLKVNGPLGTSRDIGPQSVENIPAGQNFQSSFGRSSRQDRGSPVPEWQASTRPTQVQCILSDGQELSLRRDQCRDRGGVIDE